MIANCNVIVRSPIPRFVCVPLLLICVVATSSATAMAQSKDREKGKGREDEPSSQQLEARVTKAEEALLSEYLEVANEFYKQGEKESSIEVLRRIEKINPKMDGIRQRIDAIDEELLQENGLKQDFDVSKGWQPVCEVEKGAKFRLSAVGEYKLEYDAIVPVTGLSSADPAKDHVSAGAFGALIGVIVTNNKPGEAFAINSGVELDPKDSGQLFVRVNVPAAAKCKGDLKLQLSGAIKPILKKKTP